MIQFFANIAYANAIGCTVVLGFNKLWQLAVDQSGFQWVVMGYTWLCLVVVTCDDYYDDDVIIYSSVYYKHSSTTVIIKRQFYSKVTTNQYIITTYSAKMQSWTLTMGP